MLKAKSLALDSGGKLQLQILKKKLLNVLMLCIRMCGDLWAKIIGKIE